MFVESSAIIESEAKNEKVQLIKRGIGSEKKVQVSCISKDGAYLPRNSRRQRDEGMRDAG